MDKNIVIVENTCTGYKLVFKTNLNALFFTNEHGDITEKFKKWLFDNNYINKDTDLSEYYIEHFDGVDLKEVK